MIDGQGLGESTIRSGNPMLGGIVRLGDGPWRLRAELDVTVPFAHVPLGTDGRSYAFTYNHTLAMWGMWNQWLWSTDHMAVPIQANFAYAPSPRLWLVVEAAEATLIGTRRGTGSSKIVGQLAVEAQIEVAPRLTVCPRWQTVRLPAGGIDTWQSAAGLRVALMTAAGKFFVGALVNVDEPLGVFGGLGRWGFHLGKELDL